MSFDSGSSFGPNPWLMVRVILLSAWFGVTLFVWWSATGTFEVLSAEKNPELALRLSPMPEEGRATFLRQAAGAVNGRLFRGWNLVQLAAALVVLGLVLTTGPELARTRLPSALAGAALIIVLVHAFWLGPEIEAGGRALEGAPAERASGWFALVHGAYVISDLVKAGLLGAMLWLAVRREA